MTTAERAAVDEARAADFTQRFAKFWAAPAPELLGTLLAERVRLVAPLTATTDTLAEGERVFAGLFALVPDMTAVVNDWGATESGVIIDLTITGTAGGAPISWRAIDRITLGDDGLATERVSQFDSVPLIATLIRRPSVWPGFVRTRLRR